MSTMTIWTTKKAPEEVAMKKAKALLERSRSTGGGRNNVAGIGSIASAAEVLEMLSGSCACAQNKLRAAIYGRALELLVKEEKLLEVQMRNEARQKQASRQSDEEWTHRSRVIEAQSAGGVCPSPTDGNTHFQ
ncbi:hypothetical protein MTO96_024994 [Rhipicephalus appendiculatus]